MDSSIWSTFHTINDTLSPSVSSALWIPVQSRCFWLLFTIRKESQFSRFHGNTIIRGNPKQSIHDAPSPREYLYFCFQESQKHILLFFLASAPFPPLPPSILPRQLLLIDADRTEPPKSTADRPWSIIVKPLFPSPTLSETSPPNDLTRPSKRNSILIKWYTLGWHGMTHTASSSVDGYKLKASNLMDAPALIGELKFLFLWPRFHDSIGPPKDILHPIGGTKTEDKCNS